MLMPSSQLRDLDLVKWLDNKLGDNSELWSGRQAASLLSREMLVELETCFQALESHVKLKIVLAIPHLSYRLITMVFFYCTLERLEAQGNLVVCDVTHCPAVHCSLLEFRHLIPL